MVECVPMNARRPDFFRDLDSIGFERTTNKYFPVTIKVRAERLIRVSFFKLGIYYAAKTLFKVFYKKKKNQIHLLALENQTILISKMILQQKN